MVDRRGKPRNQAAALSEKFKLIFDALYYPTNVGLSHRVVTVLLGNGVSCKKYNLGTGLITVWEGSQCKIKSCLSNKFFLLDISCKTAVSVPINI